MLPKLDWTLYILVSVWADTSANSGTESCTDGTYMDLVSHGSALLQTDMQQLSDSRSVKKHMVKEDDQETSMTKVTDKEMVGEDESDQISANATEDVRPNTGVSGCACTYNWRTNFGSCPNGYCCNPDNYKGGAWCIVQSSCLARGWDVCAPRTTTDGCQCRKNWQTSAGKCSRYCCNVDSDPGGEWCLTVDTSCVRGQNWGYCR